MVLRRFLASAIMMIALALGSAPAAKAGDAAAGRMFAESWCVHCHVVSERSRSQSTDAAPSFQSIAEDPSKNEAYLRGWLRSSHPDMPNFSLSRQVTDDLIAYILSLAPPGRHAR